MEREGGREGGRKGGRKGGKREERGREGVSEGRREGRRKRWSEERRVGDREGKLLNNPSTPSAVKNPQGSYLVIS